MISICLVKLDEGNFEITMRWYGGYIIIFKCLGYYFVCILRFYICIDCKWIIKLIRLLIIVEFYFMLIKLNCIGYRVVIYKCLGIGVVLLFYVI